MYHSHGSYCFEIPTTYTDFINDHIPYATLRSPAKSETFSGCTVYVKLPLNSKELGNRANLRYGWWKNSCTTQHAWNLVNNGIFTISTVAGFLPLTVWPHSYTTCTAPLNPSLPLLVESHLPSPDLLGRAPVPQEKPSIDDLRPSEDKEKTTRSQDYIHQIFLKEYPILIECIISTWFVHIVLSYIHIIYML